MRGRILREPKPGIRIYIDDRLVGYTNIDGFFISQSLPEGEYSVKIKGFFPWQKGSKKIKLEKEKPQFITFFV
ncbi:TPA: hypothetical protein DCX16_05105 [bacterium]|nr:hypothetical protein [bacterium]